MWLLGVQVRVHTWMRVPKVRLMMHSAGMDKGPCGKSKGTWCRHRQGFWG
jgi:hypothetical protein